MKDTADNFVQCTGSVRTQSLQRGLVPWRTGTLALTKGRHYHWEIYMTTSHGRPQLQRKIDATVLSNVICNQQRLRVELKDGSSYQLIKPTSSRDQDALYKKLLHIKQSPPTRAGLSKPSQAALTPAPYDPNLSTQPSTTPTTLLKSTPNKPQQFTNVKSLNNSTSKVYDRIFDNKPDLDCTVVNFYGTKQAEARQCEIVSNSGTRKRQPGLLPSPSPKRLCLSESSYSWHKNKTVTSPNTETHSLRGFSNLGNTCYMNAILQSLDGLDCLTADLLHSNRHPLKTVPRGTLFFNLSKLLMCKRKQNVSESVKRELLHNVKAAISSSARRFSGNQQHDAHEFLSQVLDQLKEEVLRLNKETPMSSREQTPINGVAETTTVQSDTLINPTIQTFQFDITHSLQCTQCNEVLTKTEEFNDLSIQIPTHPSGSDDDVSLQDALDTFFKEDTVEYTCAECPSLSSLAVHTFAKLPRVLILHVKRYHHLSVKISRRLLIPRYITLQRHCAEATMPACPLGLDFTPPKVTLDTDTPERARRRLEYSAKKRKIQTQSESHGSPDTTPHPPTTPSPMREVAGDWTPTHSTQFRGDVTPTHSTQPSGAVTPTHRTLVFNADFGIQSDMVLPDMSEEEMLRLAIENSLRDSTNDSALDHRFDHDPGQEQVFTVLQNRASSWQHSAVYDQRGDVTTAVGAGHEGSVDGGVDLNHLTRACVVESECEDVGQEAGQEAKERRVYVDDDGGVDSDEGPIIEPGANPVHGGHIRTTTDAEIGCPGTPTVGRDSGVEHSHRRIVTNSVYIDETESVEEAGNFVRGVSGDGENGGDTFEDLSRIKPSFRGERGDQRADTCGDDAGSEVGVAAITSVRKRYSFKQTSTGALVGAFRRDEIAPGVDVMSELVDSRTRDSPHSLNDPISVCVNMDTISGVTGAKDEKMDTIYDDSLALRGDENKENQPPWDTNQPPQDEDQPPQDVDQPQRDTNQPPQDVDRPPFTSPLFTLDGNSEDVIVLDASQEEEDLRRAKEISLREFEEAHLGAINLDVPEEQVTTAIERSPEEAELLEHNYEEGSLPQSYRLVGVVSHLGSSSVHGHYISDVYDVKTRSWFSYDDSHVTKISESAVREQRQRTGYIYFYINRDVFDKLTPTSPLS